MTHVIPLVDISIQPIELCKLLKIANMVGGGGEANEHSFKTISTTGQTNIVADTTTDTLK